MLNSILSSQIHYSKEFVRVESTTTGVIVYFADGTREEADGVVFADGVHSLARTELFQHDPPTYAGRISWRGVAQCGAPLFPDVSCREILGKGKRIGIFPLPNNKVYWYATVNMPGEKAAKQERTTDCVLSHFYDWPAPVHSLINNTADDRLVITKINYAAGIHRLSRGCMALLGDAAHPMAPDLGQGACQAIEDAYVLAQCLSENRHTAAAFKKYHNRRIRRVSKVAKNSYRMGKMRQLQHPLGVAFRNVLLRLMPESLALRILEENIRNEI